MVEIKPTQWQMVKKIKKPPPTSFKTQGFHRAKTKKKTLQKSRIYSAILPAPLSFLDVNRRPEKSK